MIHQLIAHTPVFARSRGQIIEDLMNGDPVAWSILGGVVAVGLGIHFWKKRKSE